MRGEGDVEVARREARLGREEEAACQVLIDPVDDAAVGDGLVRGLEDRVRQVGVDEREGERVVGMSAAATRRKGASTAFSFSTSGGGDDEVVDVATTSASSSCSPSSTSAPTKGGTREPAAAVAGMKVPAEDGVTPDAGVAVCGSVRDADRTAPRVRVGAGTGAGATRAACEAVAPEEDGAGCEREEDEAEF
jgi:hypothetical protein